MVESGGRFAHSESNRKQEDGHLLRFSADWLVAAAVLVAGCNRIRGVAVDSFLPLFADGEEWKKSYADQFRGLGGWRSRSCRGDALAAAHSATVSRVGRLVHLGDRICLHLAPTVGVCGEEARVGSGHDDDLGDRDRGAGGGRRDHRPPTALIKQRESSLGAAERPPLSRFFYLVFRNFISLGVR